VLGWVALGIIFLVWEVLAVLGRVESLTSWYRGALDTRLRRIVSIAAWMTVLAHLHTPDRWQHLDPIDRAVHWLADQLPS